MIEVKGGHKPLDTEKVKFHRLKAVKEFLPKITSKKYRFMILLGLDAGARTVEMRSLKLCDIDTQRNIVRLLTAKQRKKNKQTGESEKVEIYREIEMTQRLMWAASEYYATIPKYAKSNPNNFWFPAHNSHRRIEMISREVVYKTIKKYTGGNPHMLRHTFCMRLRAKGIKIDVAQKLMGHSRRSSTEVYWHIPETEMKAAIEEIDETPLSQKLVKFFQPKPSVRMLPVEKGFSKVLIGRELETDMIHDFVTRGINFIIFGEHNVGKSMLLDNYRNPEKIIIRILDLGSPTQMMKEILAHVYRENLANVVEMMYPKGNWELIIGRKKGMDLFNEFQKVTEKGQVWLFFDDITNVPKKTRELMAKLKNWCHIGACARNMKIDFEYMISNYQKIRLENLSQKEANKFVEYYVKEYDLTQRLTNPFLFRNHVIEETSANPGYMHELIERFSKEPELDSHTIRAITHTGGRKEFDLSIPIVMILSCLMVVRYIRDDAGAMRLIGGFFLVFALFARTLMIMGRKRFA